MYRRLLLRRLTNSLFRIQAGDCSPLQGMRKSNEFLGTHNSLDLFTWNVEQLFS